MPVPIYSLRSSTLAAASSSTRHRSHPYAHRDVVLDRSPLPDIGIPFKKPGILSMKWLKAKAPGWHTVVGGARDLHVIQSFDKPGGMWENGSITRSNAKEALNEMHHYYTQSIRHLKLLKLEPGELFDFMTAIRRLNIYLDYSVEDESLLTLACDVLHFNRLSLMVFHLTG
jgi:hypothetical protein